MFIIISAMQPVVSKSHPLQQTNSTVSEQDIKNGRIAREFNAPHYKLICGLLSRVCFTN